MKIPLTVIVLATLCTLSLWANSPKDSKDLPEDTLGETRKLQHFLKMEPADLANLRQTIERIERMTFEEKKMLRKRIDQLEQMRPERVKAMRERYESIPREKREVMRQRWLNLQPEERQEWQKKIRAMDPEERHRILIEQGFLPTPINAHKGKKPPRPPVE